MDRCLGADAVRRLRTVDAQKIEPVHNLEYRKLFDAAQARGTNMWNPEYCGPGPSANLRLVIQPDPVGVDDRRLNRSTSPSSTTASNGWTCRAG